jgi:hypothetical protein
MFEVRPDLQERCRHPACGDRFTATPGQPPEQPLGRQQRPLAGYPVYRVASSSTATRHVLLRLR